MFENYIIPILKGLPCKKCSISINTKCSEYSRPHGYIMIVDDEKINLSSCYECKKLLEKLQELNIPKMYTIITELKILVDTCEKKLVDNSNK